MQKLTVCCRQRLFFTLSSVLFEKVKIRSSFSLFASLLSKKSEISLKIPAPIILKGFR
ncbi:hypothetical protein MCHI_000065 [Candidatus Magnetoovum chiemensis]|nr:hypothetical protein MCHI_000065 [Candidatus Magnetoovum chiemensis]